MWSSLLYNLLTFTIKSRSVWRHAGLCQREQYGGAEEPQESSQADLHCYCNICRFTSCLCLCFCLCHFICLYLNSAIFAHQQTASDKYRKPATAEILAFPLHVCCLKYFLWLSDSKQYRSSWHAFLSKPWKHGVQSMVWLLPAGCLMVLWLLLWHCEVWASVMKAFPKHFQNSDGLQDHEILECNVF